MVDRWLFAEFRSFNFSYCYYGKNFQSNGNQKSSIWFQEFWFLQMAKFFMIMILKIITSKWNDFCYNRKIGFWWNGPWKIKDNPLWQMWVSLQKLLHSYKTQQGMLRHFIFVLRWSLYSMDFITECPTLMETCSN